MACAGRNKGNIGLSRGVRTSAFQRKVARMAGVGRGVAARLARGAAAIRALPARRAKARRNETMGRAGLGVRARRG